MPRFKRGIQYSVSSAFGHVACDSGYWIARLNRAMTAR